MLEEGRNFSKPDLVGSQLVVALFAGVVEDSEQLMVAVVLEDEGLESI
jgi:hypothetical protein